MGTLSRPSRLPGGSGLNGFGKRRPRSPSEGHRGEPRGQALWPPGLLTVDGPLERPAVGPQQAVHGFQHCLQLLPLPYLGLRHLRPVQLAAGQLFCNRKGQEQEAGSQGPPARLAAAGTLLCRWGERVVPEQPGAVRTWSPAAPSFPVLPWGRTPGRKGGVGFEGTTWERSVHTKWKKRLEVPSQAGGWRAGRELEPRRPCGGLTAGRGLRGRTQRVSDVAFRLPALTVPLLFL